MVFLHVHCSVRARRVLDFPVTNLASESVPSGSSCSCGSFIPGPPTNASFISSSCFFVRFAGIFTMTFTRRSPRLSEFMNGMPCPRRRKSVWLCVPRGIFRTALPVSVGTVISPPRSAVASPTTAVVCRSAPCRSKRSCGFHVHNHIEIARAARGFPRALLPRQFSGTGRPQLPAGSSLRSSAFSGAIPVPVAGRAGFLNPIFPLPPQSGHWAMLITWRFPILLGAPDLTGPLACRAVPQVNRVLHPSRDRSRTRN